MARQAGVLEQPSHLSLGVNECTVPYWLMFPLTPKSNFIFVCCVPSPTWFECRASISNVCALAAAALRNLSVVPGREVKENTKIMNHEGAEWAPTALELCLSTLQIHAADADVVFACLGLLINIFSSAGLSRQMLTEKVVKVASAHAQHDGIPQRMATLIQCTTTDVFDCSPKSL